MCEMRRTLCPIVANLKSLRGGFKPEFESEYLTGERSEEHF